MTVRTDPSGTANHRTLSQQPMILNCPYRLRSATSSVITVALWTLTWDAWGYLVPASRGTLGTHPVRDRPSRYHIPALRTGPHTCVSIERTCRHAPKFRFARLRLPRGNRTPNRDHPPLISIAYDHISPCQGSRNDPFRRRSKGPPHPLAVCVVRASRHAPRMIFFPASTDFVVCCPKSVPTTMAGPTRARV